MKQPIVKTGLTCVICKKDRSINLTGCNSPAESGAKIEATRWYFFGGYNKALCIACLKRKNACRIIADSLLSAWLVNVGAKEGQVTEAMPDMDWPIDTREFFLETTLGRLTVHPASSHGASGLFYEVFRRFDEPGRAAEAIGRHNMNHFSGKWNVIEYTEGLPPEIFVERVSREICRFTPSLKPYTWPSDEEDKH